MRKFSRVQIIEIEHTDGEWPMVYGKGRRKHDLVYFQLDANFIRQPQNMKKDGRIMVIEDEIIGVAEGYFRPKNGVDKRSLV